MDFITVPLVFALFSIAFLLGGVYTRREDARLDEGIHTTGTIIGYSFPSGSPYAYPEFQFQDGDLKVSASYTIGGIKSNLYPVGTELSITYFKREALGCTTYTVKPTDVTVTPIPLARMGKVLTAIGILFLLITVYSIFLVLMGEL